MKVMREIYGCIKSDLLWYNLYAKTLEYLGFSINPYDRFMANNMVCVKQCTIVWYVDDNKLLHVDPNLVTDILEEIRKNFGDLVISIYYTRDFLGMNIKIRKYKKVEIITKHKTEEKLIQFKDVWGFKVTTPCAQHLWYVNDET